MEEKESLQYTFGPDEKETLKKMDTVETSVVEHIQDKRELISTKYYSEFVINTPRGPVTFNNVFITVERDKNGEMSYHFRWIQENENGEQTIDEKIVVDQNGKVYTTGALKDCLGDAEIDIEELMAKNDVEKGRLKGISEKAEPEEIIKAKGNERQNGKEQEGQGEQGDETKEIEEDLREQGQDLELINVRKIKDPHVAERMPEVFGDSDEHAQAYSRKLGKFVMLEKKDGQVKGENNYKGQWQLNDKVEPAQTTYKTIISIDKNGDKIEKRVPHALMKTNRDDKEIAVTIGQYGEVYIETVDVLPCQERIARGVREENQGLEGEEDAQIRKEFSTQGKEYTHDLAHKVNEIEEIEKETNQAVDDQISESDYIPNTDTTWGELMQETGESLPKLVERFNNEMEQSGGKEEPRSIIQRIIDDYLMVSHEHTIKH